MGGILKPIEQAAKAAYHFNIPGIENWGKVGDEIYGGNWLNTTAWPGSVLRTWMPGLPQFKTSPKAILVGHPKAKPFPLGAGRAGAGSGYNAALRAPLRSGTTVVPALRAVSDPTAPLPGGAPSAAGYYPPASGGGATAGGGSFDILGYMNTLMKGLPNKAHALALADVLAQVGAVRTEQQMLLNEARQRASQIGFASNAAANILKPIAGQTLAAYRNAAKDQAGFAQGYTGLAEQQATTNAQQVANVLNNLGAPAGTTTLTGINTATQPKALGNLVYSLGGAIPASTLEQAGLANYGYQKQLPAGAVGAGKAASLATLGAGSTAAENLYPQILNAEGQLPKLTSSYLTSLSSQAQNQALLPLIAAQKYDTLPGNNPITGAPTSKQVAINQADQRIFLEGQQITNTADRNALYGEYTQARIAALKKGPNSAAAKTLDSDMKRIASASSDLEKWVKGTFIGQGANEIPIQPVTDYATLYKRVVTKYPNVAVKYPKIIQALVNSWANHPAAATVPIPGSISSAYANATGQ